MELPPHIRKIPSFLCYGCNALEEINIPDGVTEIEEWAFRFTGLKKIYLPDSVKKVGEQSFGDCRALRSVRLSENLTEIPWGTFKKCTSLRSIEIPSKIRCIGNRAFRYCTNLRDVVLREGLQTIDTKAFEKCYSLRSVELPGSVTEIGPRAFRLCKRLRKITIHTKRLSPEHIGDRAWEGLYRRVIVRCPRSKKELYRKWFTENGRLAENAIWR